METEVLTARGWARYETISQDDYVAGFDAQTSGVEWTPIKHIIKRALGPDEQMFAIQSPTVDIRVTGGHRMLMRHRRSPDTAWRFMEAGDLAQKRSDYQIPVAGFQSAAGVPLSADELRFVGLWMADGTINKKTQQVTIVQAAHQPQNADIVAILEGCGLSYNVWEHDRETQYNATSPVRHYTIRRGRGTPNALSHIDPYLDKSLAPEMERLTAAQLGHVLEGLHIGDGIKERNVTWTRQTYHIVTGNLTFAERLQSLCVRRGYRCNLATRATPTGEAYTLHVKLEDRRAIGGASQEDRERLAPVPSRNDEQVWCVSNRLQTLIIRRNGKVSIVGNCMGRGLRPANGKATASEDCLILDFMPEDVRNIVMAGDVLGVPKEQADAVRELLEEEGDEEELAQVGFTFDGEHFDYGSSPMEIIARQLDYLNQSGLAWFPPTGIRREGESLTVGLGPGSDGIERILAIRNAELYGIARNVAPQGERSQPWRVRLIACEDAYAEAEAIAARWAAPTLSSKAAQWRRGPLSEGQARYLKRLAKGRLTPAQIGGLSKGEAAQWITHCQALDALDSAKAVEVSG
jgi:hypothetical protein